MGLVRDNIPDDVEGLTQWVYRKLRNHDPMEKRVNKRLAATPKLRRLRGADKYHGLPGRQFVTADHRHVGYVLETGEAFLIEVKPITPEELKKLGVGNLGE